MNKFILWMALGLFSLPVFADIAPPTIPNWETVTPNGFGNENNLEVSAVYLFKDMHFAATYNEVDGAQIYVSTRDSNYQDWAQVVQLPKQHPGIWRFIEYKGRLYAGSVSYTVKPPAQYPAVIIATSDGFNWSPVMSNGFGDSKNAVVRSLAVINDQLYAGTSHSYYGKIYRSGDGSNWDPVEARGLGVQYLTHTWAMVPYLGEIYSAHNMGVIGHSKNGDKNTWSVFTTNFGRPQGGTVGNSDDKAVMTGDVEALAVYRGYLVAGATDRLRGAGIWTYNPNENQGAWTLASEFGIIGNNTDNISARTIEVGPHPLDPSEQVMFVGTWGRAGASVFMTSSAKPPFQWQEIGNGGFGYYTMAPAVREVRRIGEYLYIAISGRGTYGNSPGKLLRIYLWDSQAATSAYARQRLGGWHAR